MEYKVKGAFEKILNRYRLSGSRYDVIGEPEINTYLSYMGIKTIEEAIIQLDKTYPLASNTKREWRY